MAGAARAPDRLTAVGAHIFAGGFTLGMKQHFKVTCHLEEDNYGVATMRHNQPEIPVYYGPETWPLDTLEADLVYGNPPCAAWSQAGNVVFGKDWRDDPRIACTKLHFSLLEKLRPRAWVWESVVRAYTAGRELVDQLTEEANVLNYHVTYLLHDAKYLGLAQNRPRFFFIAHDFELPKINLTWETLACGEVLRRMNDIGDTRCHDTVISKNADLLPLVPPGGSLRKTWEKEHPDFRVDPVLGRVIGRPSFAIQRLDATLPSKTVAGYAMIHPTEDRALTFKEMLTLCGYPPDYEFVGSGIESQLARGVLPPVGAWLGDLLKRGMKRDRSIGPGTTELDLRRPA